MPPALRPRRMFPLEGPPSSAAEPGSGDAPLFGPMVHSRLQPHVNTYADRRANAVAIVSPDPLLSALVGAAVELIGYRAEFPRADESATMALRRLRPAYLLIDAEDPAALDETVLGRGLMSGARIFLFGTEARVQSLRDFVARYHLELIVFPRDVAGLAEILSRRAQSPEGRLAD